MTVALAPLAQRVHGRWVGAALRCLNSGGSLVLITVVRSLGSTPRDAGTRMWVDAGGPCATIGGGHLELQAIDTARTMLADAGAPAAQIRHYALGPSLGQCCGGAVWLAFERLDRADISWCEAFQALLDSGASVRRTRQFPVLNNAHDAGRASSQKPEPGVALEPLDALVVTQPDASWKDSDHLLVDVTPGAAPLVVVCGAGHVGKAIVRVLAELPVSVVWLDPREDEWPADLPDNVLCVNGDADDVPDFPDDAYWLVLTHSHALDLDIIEHVLRHKSFRYLGLIGSKTKAAKFRSRLLRKFPPAMVDRIVCPIGIVETSSKLPGVIAVSVAAQLVGLLEHVTSAGKL
ncbi:xanthine dehydrogenase accessory protein XdhC [Pusillimonas sp.]|uniref:xanthine dehydrogenase accessory protein XdhC n=1 Tax=Pusillimonas sp. TaxID=3040095 RepID=UPI0037C8DCA6